MYEGLRTCFYPDFGLYIWKGKRLYLTFRCGEHGQRGNGGHSHNDQLSIELWIDGKPIIVDPGTYLYTSSMKERNRYRSIRAHHAPQFMELTEPASLDQDLFYIPDKAQAKCISLSNKEITGMHIGFGFPVYRRIEIFKEKVQVTDWHDSFCDLIWKETEPIKYSPGYGIKTSSVNCIQNAHR